MRTYGSLVHRKKYRRTGGRLNQTTGDSYTYLPELSSIRHAHEENPVALQTCAQRTLLRLGPKGMWFDLRRTLANRALVLALGHRAFA
jgi:hypothetical protein